MQSRFSPLLGENANFPNKFIKKNILGDWMIKQFLNSVIPKYRDLSMSHRSIICLSRIIDLPAIENNNILLNLVQ